MAIRLIHTSINKMHVALDFMGRNSAYSVTLIGKSISSFIFNQISPFNSINGKKQ